MDGVTNAGVIYGDYADYVINNGNQPGWQGFLNNNGVVTLIAFPGANITTLAGINAAGTIVGNYEIGGNTTAGWIGHGFVDSNGSFTAIDVPGAYTTSVVGISDAGEIVGNYQDSSNNTHGFVDNNGVFTTINIAGATSTGVSAVNSVGEIVGYYADSGGNIHGFVDNGGVITTVDVPGATETGILGVNAAGVISGYYNDSSYNQHGFVGTPLPATVIESFGSTSLVQAGNNYFLDSISTGTGPEVMYGGAPLTVGEFAWTPIGAEQTSIGYEIALKNAATGQYTVWIADSGGNVAYDASGVLSGSSAALEAYETSFHQDLNGDGVIGIPSTTSTVIEAFGSTSLVQVESNYFLDSHSTGTGPEVMYGGAPLTVGEFAWTPIGAEQTSIGYEIALKNAATGQYTVWIADSGGNVAYDPVGSLSGSSAALETYETSFHQDLNGDGVIGQAVEAAATLELADADSGSVKFNGSTGTLILDHAALFSGQLLNFTGDGNLSSSDQIDLRDIAFGPGTTVGYVGTSSGGTLTVSDAESHSAHITLAGDYTGSTFSLSSDGKGGTVVVDPPGQQDIASGTISFSDPDPTDTHSVGVSPQDGATGYLGSFIADTVNAENVQDTVGWHFNFGSGPVTQTITQSYNVSVADHHADGTTSTATQSVSVTIAGPGNDSFVFHPGVGSDTIVNAGSADTIELDGFSSVTSNNQLTTLLHDAQTGQSQSLFESVNDGHDTLINLGNHDSITLTNTQIADLHASNFTIH